jgi:lipopolysaccharide export system protein LptA
MIAFLIASALLTSDHFHYDGNKAHLEGHVSLDHPWGKILSDKADLEYDPKKQKGPFSQIELQGNVDLKKETLSIKCDRASLNCLKSEGVFWGAPILKAFYIIKEKPFYLESKEAWVKVVNNELNELIASGDVKIEWDKRIKASGPYLYVTRVDTQYIIELKPDPIVVLDDVHEIKGTQVKLKSQDEAVEVEKPRGKLKQGEIEIEADHMVWAGSILTLKGNVKIRLKDQGTLMTDSTLRLKRGSDLVWETVEVDGPLSFSKVESDKEKSFNLIASKGAFGNLRNHEITFYSQPGKPVHLIDALGEAYGDTLTLYYKEKALDKVVLQGDVYLSHILNSEVERSYARADQVSYDPKIYETILESKDGRVFIFDKVNQVEVSAPRIRLIRDPVTKKESIKGEGDVRFELLQNEFLELKKRFKFEES